MTTKGLSIGIYISIAFWVASPSPGWPQGSMVQTIGNGEINWNQQVIRAKGGGAPASAASSMAAARILAIRAAKADALRNLLETIKGVRIDSETLVTNAMTESDVIRTQVEGVVQGALIVDTKYMPDGGVEVTMEISLAGSLMKAILPPTSFATQVAPDPQNLIYTGIIFDARGVNLRPSMSPKVFDEEGRDVYGSALVSMDWANKYGIVGYSNDLNTARKNDRVSSNPLVFKGLRTSGSGNSDLVISNSDAQTLRGMAKGLRCLEQCRVLVVID